jgi:chromosome segregation ATPase
MDWDWYKNKLSGAETAISRLEEQHDSDLQTIEAGATKLHELDLRLAAVQAEAQQSEEHLKGLLNAAQEKAEAYRSQSEGITIRLSRSEEQAASFRLQGEKIAMEAKQVESKLGEVSDELIPTKTLFDAAQAAAQSSAAEK